jgi:hypothetical protein
MDTDDFKKIEEMFKHHVGIMSESFNQKLDLIIAAQRLTGEKLYRMCQG